MFERIKQKLVALWIAVLDFVSEVKKGYTHGFMMRMYGIEAKELLKNNSGALSAGALTGMIIGLVIALIVLYALYPTLSGDAATAVNSTKSNSLFNGVNGLVLVPVIIFFVVVIALMASVLTKRE